MRSIKEARQHLAQLLTMKKLSFFSWAAIDLHLEKIAEQEGRI